MIATMSLPDTCAVESRYEAGMTQLSAVMTPAGRRSGHFELKVMTRTADGVSSNLQAGSFAAEPGQKSDLSRVSTNAAAGQWGADLQIFDDAGNLLCAFSVPMP